jgi:DNA-binding response OmpR family regulator
LVVEDEPQLAATIVRGLDAAGFSTDVATTGDDGYWKATEFSYAAILLDIMLPGMNGFKVCQRLREEGVTTPIVMLTAKEGELDEAECLDLGADDFIRKPFSHVVLVARLRAAIRRSAGSADGQLTVGALTVDQQRRLAQVDGCQVELTEREFTLLEVLARAAPDVVAKADLLDEVWGVDFAGDPNIVEVYVGYLRKKLGRSAVKTVRGVGYQLVG